MSMGGALPLFEYDLFIPRYRPLSSGAWKLLIAPMVLCPGYWSGTVLVTEMAGLIRDGVTWMSMTPMELESQETGIRLAHGHVLIYGLGMGWSALVSALREEVETVTVVERDPEILALHRELDVFSQIPPEARAKIRLLEGDALAHVPDGPVDLLMPDIWARIAGGPQRVEEVRRMQANVGAKSVYFWGQEMEIARHLRQKGHSLDATGIAGAIADFGLPLIGLELPSYPERLAAAADRYLRPESAAISQ